MMPDMTAPRGWLCPCCNRVYSPTTPMCFTCGGKTFTAPDTGRTDAGAVQGACSNCWGSGVGINGWPCPTCKKHNQFNLANRS